MGLRGPRSRVADLDEARAVSIFMESTLFFAVPHLFTANRIHFAEKCSCRQAPRELDEARPFARFRRGVQLGTALFGELGKLIAPAIP
jgi:hypothetical protein